MISTSNRTWEAVQLAPVPKQHSECVVGCGSYAPLVTDIMRRLKPHTFGDLGNITMTVVMEDYRLLSYSHQGQPYVYAIIAFDRAETSR